VAGRLRLRHQQRKEGERAEGDGRKGIEAARLEVMVSGQDVKR